jgi:hypothetical protein
MDIDYRYHIILVHQLPELVGIISHIKSKIYSRFVQWTGDDSVFPTKNGSPKILTKFVDHPYSYELLPEYENGEKKLPCVKAMNWEGKTSTAHVIRGFIKGTGTLLESEMHLQIGNSP